MNFCEQHVLPRILLRVRLTIHRLLPFSLSGLLGIPLLPAGPSITTGRQTCTQMTVPASAALQWRCRRNKQKALQMDSIRKLANGFASNADLLFFASSWLPVRKKYSNRPHFLPTDDPLNVFFFFFFCLCCTPF